jgi:hypothetical protein
MPVTDTFDLGPDVRERVRARALERGGQIRRRRSMVRRSLTLALIVTLPVAGILVARQAGRPTVSNVTTSSLPALVPPSSWKITGSFSAVAPATGEWMGGTGGELASPGVPGLWEIEWDPNGRPILFGFNSQSGRLVAQIPLPVPATRITVTKEAVEAIPMIGAPVISGTAEWIGSAHEIVGVDLLTHRVIARIPNPAGTIGVLVSDGSLWVATRSQLERLSESTGQVTAAVNVPAAGSCGISPAASGSGEIVVVTYSYPCNASNVARGTETIYTVDSARAVVVHQFTLAVGALQIAPGPFQPLAVTPGLVWGSDVNVSSGEGPEFVALDQATGASTFRAPTPALHRAIGTKVGRCSLHHCFGRVRLSMGGRRRGHRAHRHLDRCSAREVAIVPVKVYANSIINGVAQDEVSGVSFTSNDAVVHISESGPLLKGDVVLEPTSAPSTPRGSQTAG